MSVRQVTNPRSDGIPDGAINESKIAVGAIVPDHFHQDGLNGVGAGGSDSLLNATSLVQARTMDPLLASSNFALADAEARMQAVYIPKTTVITGVTFIQDTQGSYTGDQTNQVGLYSVSGDTLTLVASSANNANLWKAANNTVVQEPFAAAYTAAPGLYYIGHVYNQSAETTAPKLKAAAVQTAALVNVLSASSRLRTGKLTAQNALPASTTLSGLTTTGAVFYLGLY